MLPSDFRMTSEVRDLFVECCTEFINLVSSEANEISTKEDKKTISPEHVMNALTALGFDRYLTECQACLAQHKQDSKEGPRQNLKRARSDMGMSEEEAIAAQQALFAAARARMNDPQAAAVAMYSGGPPS
mmetsp:Transcript_39624/g.86344  ORF Transcript_39624/g.86344 Transcript_39624/m.86344 type:complete len:130 (+) Transcript_39624:381-770(+)